MATSVTPQRVNRCRTRTTGTEMKVERVRGSVAAVSLVVGTAWLLAGCGEDRVRVPAEWARPADPVLCPERASAGQPFDARTLIGMAERDAERRAREYGCELRVAVSDGDGNDLTGDDRYNRVDVYVEDGRIVGVNES